MSHDDDRWGEQEDPAGMPDPDSEWAQQLWDEELEGYRQQGGRRTGPNAGCLDGLGLAFLIQGWWIVPLLLLLLLAKVCDVEHSPRTEKAPGVGRSYLREDDGIARGAIVLGAPVKRSSNDEGGLNRPGAAVGRPARRTLPLAVRTRPGIGGSAALPDAVE